MAIIDKDDGNVLTGAAWQSVIDTVGENQDRQDYVQVYTGSGFDSSVSTTGVDTQDHELTAITSSALSSANYLVISITGTASFNTDADTEQARIEVKIQTKDVGGSYSDSLGYVYFLRSNQNDSDSDRSGTVTMTLSWIHTLTNDEKSNGVQVKLFSQSTRTNGSGGGASFTNVQSSITLK